MKRIYIISALLAFVGLFFIFSNIDAASILFVHQGGTATSSTSSFNPRPQAWEVETFITKRIYSTSTALTIGSTGNNAINFVTTATSTFDSGLVITNGGIDINLPSCDSLDTDSNGAIVCGTDATGAGGSGNIVFELFNNVGIYATTTGKSLFVRGGLSATSSTALFEVAGDGHIHDLLTLGRFNATSTVSTSTIAYGLDIANGGIDINLPSCDSLDTDSNGAIVCGTDNAGSGTFAWTHTTGTNINATTSILAFNSGFYSVGSSTIHGNATTTGSLYVGSIIKQNSSGTSTFVGGIYANALRFNQPSCNSASKLITDSDGAITCALEALDGAYTGTYDGNNFGGGAIGVGDILYGSAAGTISELAAGTRGTILSMTTGGIPGWVSTSTFAHLNVNNVYTGSGTTTLRNNEAFFGKIAIGGTATTTIRGNATSSFSGGLNVLSGGLQFSLPSCDSLDTDANGAIVCGVDASGSSFSYPFTTNSHTGTTTALTVGGLSSSGAINASSTVHTSNQNTMELSTGAQLFFRDDGNYAHWAMRNAGGNLYFATTTVGTNSTSSPFALQLTGTGGTGLFVGTTTNKNATGLAVAGTIFSSGLTNSNTGDYVCFNTVTGEIEQNATACSLSSIRWKENIREIDGGLDKILGLHPRIYDLKPQYGTAKNQPGFIAEEALDATPLLVSYGVDGEVSGFDYPKLTVYLVKAVQELSEREVSPINYLGLLGLLGLIPLFRKR